ncbi:hypothetical protein LaLC_57690 [Bacillus anthracis]|uniref:Uncharacterized protein n=1 Tax=Bacillus anthracis TaxID=1392 RepID=A0A640MN82_BACAN|nr:hypothetical protein LaLC_57690 [Bacillus anthracis]
MRPLRKTQQFDNYPWTIITLGELWSTIKKEEQPSGVQKLRVAT